MINRLHTITQKIPREASGLKGALFCHIDFDQYARAVGVRVSFKQKDASSLDNILSVIGDAFTEILEGQKDG